VAKRKDTGLDPDAQALWEEVARTVAPLKNRPTLAPGLKSNAPRRHIRTQALSPMPVQAPATTHAVSVLAERGGEKRVRRGRVEPVARLDLHGFTQEGARRAVQAFVMRVFSEGGGVAIIVTGKGARLVSGETAPGVLKQRLPEWLSAPDLRAYLAGYAQAHMRHGGGGAFYVWVRSRP
jgi:DNA-nicking Smr family endonuclease